MRTASSDSSPVPPSMALFRWSTGTCLFPSWKPRPHPAPAGLLGRVRTRRTPASTSGPALGRLCKALAAEFLGTLLFTLFAGAAGGGPLETAASYAALVYLTQHLSGGHLNPVISLAGAGTGHIDLVRGVLYAGVQVLGAIAGALLQVGLVYDNHVGQPSEACFKPPRHVSGPQVWGWELLLTFFFVAVFYVVSYVPPGYGSTAPLALGLAMLAALSTGGFYTGFSSLNPARVLANMLVFRCNVGWSWTYLASHIAAIGAAVAWVWPVHGLGMFFGGQRPDAFTGPGRSVGGGGGGSDGVSDPLLPRGGAATDPAGTSAYP